MATSIFFTESKDFKLIKARILSQEDDYLVYVYADTSNIRIPRELIMELPKYGNNLIWVDTADMDSADISHHMVLTIGQLMNPEEEIDFYIVSKSSKLEKTIIFLRNQGIPAEMISPAPGIVKAEKTKVSGRRGRPKKAKVTVEAVEKTGKRGRPKKEKPVEAVVEAVVKTGKRGRPKKEKPVVEAVAKTGKRGRPKKVQPELVAAEPDAVVETPRKKRGRPAAVKEVPAAAKIVKAKKTPRKKADKAVAPVKTRKRAGKTEAAEEPQIEASAEVMDTAVIPAEAPVIKKEKKKAVKAKKAAKSKDKTAKPKKAAKPAKAEKAAAAPSLTQEEAYEKAVSMGATEANVATVLTSLFQQKKTARPKTTAKLVDAIKRETQDDDTVAERIIEQLVEMQIITTGNGGRITYKD
jgi:hypothetical protein